jgi:AraC family transcriptional regulator of adaptative response/methylated-DNA-[protein]-cysteine methyltransferase
MLTPKDEELQSSAERLKAWIAEPQHACPLPIDRTHGTEFQRLVWQHLEAIPFGSTWTYQQLANTLGRPKSVRAVARACGANPVALIVPCHRVIGRDGSLRGYRWGLSTKQQLLAWEEQAGIARRAEEFDHSRGRLADAELVVG